MLLAVWSVGWLVVVSAGDLPRVREIGLDTSVVMITLVVSVLTGLAFGLAPAWRATRASFSESFKESSTRLAGSVRRERLRSLLVVGEVALAFILLIGAALLIQSFVKLQKVSPGFATDNRLVVKLSLPWARYAEIWLLARHAVARHLWRNISSTHLMSVI